MMKQAKGFSLLELMVVIAIVAISATLAFPSFERYRERSRLRGAARDIVSSMQRARINAIRDTLEWKIQFYPDEKRFEVVHAGEDLNLETEDDVVVDTVRLADIGRELSFGSANSSRPGADADPNSGTHKGVTFGGHKVEFNPDGTSMAGNVYVMNEQGQTIAVGSLANTGRIKTWVDWGTGWTD